jgi:alkanesulfonate monooxygenase SsuD/methylene tetrahydromethanopterin reductase-like flavin-dependent oxidoreductase (luciferase family)
MVFGIGVGAIKEESDALGSDFESRGRYANESLAIMKELWASESTSFEGEFFRFENMVFSPKSTQKPHPPIWVGGTSRPAMRRAAKYGDGWHPTRVSPQGFTEALPYLQRHLDANGRGLTDMTLSSRVELEVTSSLNPSIDGTLVGAPDQLLAIIEGYDKVGVQEIVLAMSTGSIDEIERRMTDFVEKVKPLV